jgi:hypothetical protein
VLSLALDLLDMFGGIAGLLYAPADDPRGRKSPWMRNAQNGVAGRARAWQAIRRRTAVRQGSFQFARLREAIPATASCASTS